MIHGNLKGVRGLDSFHPCIDKIGTRQATILVDVAGHARITDIGLSIVAQNIGSTQSASAEPGYGMGWVAPEVLDDQKTCSKEADIFSFAGVAIEVRFLGDNK